MLTDAAVAETEPCCCDAGQETGPSRSDMALNATSDGGYDYAPRFANSDADTQRLILIQDQIALKISNGIGPPFASFYLTNLTFRC